VFFGTIQQIAAQIKCVNHLFSSLDGLHVDERVAGLMIVMGGRQSNVGVDLTSSQLMHSHAEGQMLELNM